MARVSPRLAGLALLATVLMLAGALTQLDLRLASSQAVTLAAKEAEAEVPPDDPVARVWDSAEPVEIPLSAQNVATPQGGGSIRAVTVRALNDGERIFFRLEWADATQDVSAFAAEDFRDAAAIQFPSGGVSTLPSFCMGQADGRVNIWHWKADWQADIDRGFVNVPEAYPNAVSDDYPFKDEDLFYPGRAAGNVLSQTERKTPVENLVAAGFGTLTTAEEQSVAGKGIWQNGKWYVLFAREMEAGEDYTPFKPGQTTNVAFAVWDGAAGERDGLKSVSQFADLKVEGVARAEGKGGPVVWVFVMAGVVIVFMIMAYARVRAGRREQ